MNGQSYELRLNILLEKFFHVKDLDLVALLILTLLDLNRSLLSSQP